MKLELCRQTFGKPSNISFHENPSSGSRVVPCAHTNTQADMTKPIVASPNFANAPDKRKKKRKKAAMANFRHTPTHFNADPTLPARLSGSVCVTSGSFIAACSFTSHHLKAHSHISTSSINCMQQTWAAAVARECDAQYTQPLFYAHCQFTPLLNLRCLILSFIYLCALSSFYTGFIIRDTTKNLLGKNSVKFCTNNSNFVRFIQIRFTADNGVL